MKPYQILTFLISVFLVLLCMAILFPENGVKIGDDVSLRFAQPEEFFSTDSVSYADITDIIEHNAEAAEAPENVSEVQPGENGSLQGSEEGSVAHSPSPDSLKKITRTLEFPGNDPEILYPFFREINRIRKTHKLVRILHYGDSQIEADRMTGYIRHQLQSRFGGSGCGLIPVIPLYDGIMSVKQENAGNWERYTGFINQDSSLGHKRYGALFTFARFQAVDSLSGSKAMLSFSPTGLGYRSSRIFNRFSLFLGGKQERSAIRVYAGDSLLDSVNITSRRSYRHLTWKTPSTPHTFRLEFTGSSSPEIYGISLDNSWGLAVDNIPLRGSSGLVFSKVDTVLLKKMYEDLDVGLILLQFGGNVIPYLKEDYDYYERLFKRELGVIRRMLPAVPVVVIGPSDMSVKENGKYVTYSNLEPVRDVLKKAAMESGCAFWDMYEAMGGRNSMPSWVLAEPQLAMSDFVHFNPRGARIVGEMFCNAFLYEYDRWLKKFGDLVK